MTRRPEFGSQPLRWRDPAGIAPASLDIRVFSCARWIVRDALRDRWDALLGESRDVGEVRREQTLEGHDMGAQAVDLEVIALAVPLISGEADLVGVVVATERDLQGPEVDPLRL